MSKKRKEKEKKKEEKNYDTFFNYFFFSFKIPVLSALPRSLKIYKIFVCYLALRLPRWGFFSVIFYLHLCTVEIAYIR